MVRKTNKSKQDKRVQAKRAKCSGGSGSPTKIFKDFQDDRAKALPPAICWGDPLRSERDHCRAKAPPRVKDAWGPLRAKRGYPTLS